MSGTWWRLVRFGFRLLYNEFAFTYDLVSWTVSLGAWRCWTRAALDHLPAASDGRVLELAHGTGNLQLDLHERGYDIYGFDLSPAMGQITSGKLRRHGYRVSLARSRAQALPFADGAFAAVISTFPTDYIADARTLREVTRVLSPDGTLIIVPNAALTGGGLLARFLEWLYWVTGQRGTSYPERVTGFFAPYGFDVDVVTKDCPRSRVTLLVARKIPSGA